jgi:SSS family solute:Na+ symporter
MFPHLFQHWLTARSAKSFRLSIVFHPIFIMIVWIPCVLIGIWSAGIGIEAPGGNSNAVLAVVVNKLVESPVISGLLTAGILAAIMSSLDSQFVCLGTMFTHDIVLHSSQKSAAMSDTRKLLVGRAFIVFIVVVVYGLSLLPQPRIFDLGVWCFSGFASLFPLVFAAIYWRRVTSAGAIASVLVMAATWTWFFYEGLLAPLARGETISEDHLVLGVMPVTFIFAASALTLWIVSLLTTPPPREHVERFFIDPA